MRVSLNVFGGLTGGAAPVVLDSDQLDAGARDELRTLVSAATAAQQHRTRAAPTESPVDGQVYEITIDDGTVLEATDGAVSAEFAALRKWLREHA